MSSATTRVPLAHAREIADDLAALLQSACERIVVAGSIRREAADCGDIDLVCEPKIIPGTDMFGDPTGDDQDVLHDRCIQLVQYGVLSKRLNVNGQASWGKQLKRAVYRDLSVDIQAVADRDSWGFWLLIRTGPALFNKALVTPRWQGGLLPPGFEVKDGFKLYRGGGRIPTPREEDVFEALGLPYTPPSARSTIGGAE